LPISGDKIGKDKPSLFDQKDVIEVVYQNGEKDSNNNRLMKTVKNNKTINNRIRHPEYWKELKSRTF